MTSYDQDLERLFLTVACPTCKAAPGHPCDYRGGRHRTTHLARQDRAVTAEQRTAGVGAFGSSARSVAGHRVVRLAHGRTGFPNWGGGAMSTCARCWRTLPTRDGPGRPLVYCSLACRRATEHDRRRIQRAQQRQAWLAELERLLTPKTTDPKENT